MGNCTVTLDTAAFSGEDSGQRSQQRGQRIIRGTISPSANYAPSGDACDLSNYFPRSGFDQTVKYRVLLNPVDNTGAKLAVYDHTNKTLWVFNSLGAESSGDLHALVWSFIAIGE